MEVLPSQSEEQNAVAVIFLQSFLIEKSALSYYATLVDKVSDFILNSVLHSIINRRGQHLQELQSLVDLRGFKANGLEHLYLDELLELPPITDNLEETQKMELIFQNTINLEQNIIAFYNILEQECSNISTQPQATKLIETIEYFESVSFNDFLQPLLKMQLSLHTSHSSSSKAEELPTRGALNGSAVDVDLEKWLEILLKTQKNPEVLKEILLQFESAKKQFENLKNILETICNTDFNDSHKALKKDEIKNFLEKIDFSMLEGFIIGKICAMLSGELTEKE